MSLATYQIDTDQPPAANIATKPHAAAESNNMKKSPVEEHDADEDDLSSEDISKDGSVDYTVDEPSTQWWMWQNSPAVAAIDGPQDDQQSRSEFKDDSNKCSTEQTDTSDPRQDDRTDSNANDEATDDSNPKSAASSRDDGPSSPEARPCLYAPGCGSPGEYPCECEYCPWYSCWEHVVKCTGVQKGKALICAFRRHLHLGGRTPRLGLEAAEGQKANFTWNAPREEWDAALHASLLEDIISQNALRSLLTVTSVTSV